MLVLVHAREQAWKSIDPCPPSSCVPTDNGHGVLDDAGHRATSTLSKKPRHSAAGACLSVAASRFVSAPVCLEPPALHRRFDLPRRQLDCARRALPWPSPSSRTVVHSSTLFMSANGPPREQRIAASGARKTSGVQLHPSFSASGRHRPHATPFSHSRTLVLFAYAYMYSGPVPAN
ncbi:hypothetical protein RJ55_08267 [Drechmeria coniospora]|nr:hypothetical protein RJ55_08267 [Drechmeria coniospora]